MHLRPPSPCALCSSAAQGGAASWQHVGQPRARLDAPCRRACITDTRRAAADRFESLAFFSSIGPTLDGRVKPDIVAPGTTISAYAAECARPAARPACRAGLQA